MSLSTDTNGGGCVTVLKPAPRGWSCVRRRTFTELGTKMSFEEVGRRLRCRPNHVVDVVLVLTMLQMYIGRPDIQ